MQFPQNPGRFSRRDFVKTVAVGAAAAPALRASGMSPASQRLRLGLIGCGGRGRELLGVFCQWPDVEVSVVSDVIESRMVEASQLLTKDGSRKAPDREVEHERILDRQDIDAVVIATTQHWHGRPFIQAALAGKPIYVEKPQSHTVAEGRAMVEAAQKTGVLAMSGTQQRGYAHYLAALDVVHSGRLGKIGLVECWNVQNLGHRTGKAKDTQPPAGLNWDRWLGPAPYVPFNPSRLNNSWWFDYAGGMTTNWAIHHIDIILWAMRAQSPASVACPGGKLVVDDLADTPDTVEASWQFPDFLMHYTFRGFNSFPVLQGRGKTHGILFHGNQATLLLDRSGYILYEERDPTKILEQNDNPRFWRDGKPGNEVDGPWQRTFADCVKAGSKPPVTMEESHQATVCCHLANIAYRVGRSIRWDGKAETIVGDAEAAALLSRPRRKGYELSAV
ncbi:MAG: Gfo/Idh/MocA family protein [Thermoguttaceae bacterium]